MSYAQRNYEMFFLHFKKNLTYANPPAAAVARILLYKFCKILTTTGPSILA